MTDHNLIATLFPEAEGLQIKGVSLDSRTVTPGDLYVGLPGERAHGASFAQGAADRGAVAVLTDARGAELAGGAGLPIAVVDNPRRTMADVAVEVYDHPTDAVTMFGITGTNGKTTTTFFLEYALEELGRKAGSIGTIGFRLGQQPLDVHRTTVTTPESPDLQALLRRMVDQGADAVAMEVSSHAMALDRVSGFQFDVAAFNNLGRDHLDFHKTMENYFEAKALLFTPEHAEAAVANIDDEKGREIVRRASAAGLRVTTTGFAEDAEHRIVDWHPTDVGAHVELDSKGRHFSFDIDMPGVYNVRNAVMAFAMLDLAGLDAPAAIPGLSRASVPGRMQLIRLDGDDAPKVYVDFAHTPQAIASALSAAPRTGKVYCVVGAGGDRDAAKRAPMGLEAANGSDVVIVTDDNPRTEDPASIRAAVVEGAKQGAAEVIDGGDRRHAIGLALQMAGPQDAVLVLGKGHETIQDIGGQLIEFDDAQVVNELWNQGGQR